VRQRLDTGPRGGGERAQRARAHLFRGGRVVGEHRCDMVSQDRGDRRSAAGKWDVIPFPYLTSGLNFTQNRRFEFAVAAAAGAVDRAPQDGEATRRLIAWPKPDRASCWPMMRPRWRGRDGAWGPP